ncbi:hypothetical protein UFOVP658_135 [uncultured Caudovirales phage]|uniref:Uncharacterized protein n=1 Tax=uncultured Caudovirales phage TaxID=2100421 RepID=A0A6J5NCW8_9CAUD|nr:hypothetical protein UFOVP658_135 [uncultured Caudovirales phage]
MPGLRYGRDITDDAAELLRNIDESRRLVGEARTPADRAAARSRLSNFEDALQAAYGDRRTAQALAADAYDFTGTFTDKKGNTYRTREPLSDRAYAAYRRVSGKVRTIKTIKDENGQPATNIGRAMGDARRNPRTPGLSELGRQVAGQGVQNIIDEAANRPRGSRTAPTKATGQALSKNRGAAGARAAAKRAADNTAGRAKRRKPRG